MAPYPMVTSERASGGGGGGETARQRVWRRDVRRADARAGAQASGHTHLRLGAFLARLYPELARGSREGHILAAVDVLEYVAEHRWRTRNVRRLGLELDRLRVGLLEGEAVPPPLAVRAFKLEDDVRRLRTAHHGPARALAGWQMGQGGGWGGVDGGGAPLRGLVSRQRAATSTPPSRTHRAL